MELRNILVERSLWNLFSSLIISRTDKDGGEDEEQTGNVHF